MQFYLFNNVGAVCLGPKISTCHPARGGVKEEGAKGHGRGGRSGKVTKHLSRVTVTWGEEGVFRVKTEPF